AGEPRHFSPGAVTAPSLMGFLYLVTFGSLIGFTAYIYLLGATTPAKASTYAYVNPVVAVVLGWSVAGEPLTGRMLLAAAVILGGVALITLTNTRGPARRAAVTSSNRHRDVAGPVQVRDGSGETTGVRSTAASGLPLSDA
ncbi:MAG TPA: EamA family transporter, partial [Gemmatimonadaceae bacterium]|nr:EamA family transporter [Gemmatimonadaceae bacterium]